MEDKEIDSQLILLNEIVEKIQDEEKNPWINKILDRYMVSSRPYCPASFSAQDSSDMNQRFHDMVGGIPFTNAEYPWPETPQSQMHMQPLVQLNLSNAGEALGLDVGEGLLQVWGGVYNTWDDCDFRDPLLLRVIPSDQLHGSPSDFIPTEQPWLNKRLVGNAPVFFMDLQEDHPAFGLPLIRWKAVRPMFGNFHHLYNLLTSDEIEEMGGTDEYWPLAELIEDQVNTSELVIGGDWIYLGGLGGQAGGEVNDPTYSINLLLRLEDSAGFHMGVGMEKNRAGKWNFSPSMTIRAA